MTLTNHRVRSSLGAVCLTLLLLAACGGRAAGPDEALGGRRFLADCEQSCGGGLDCVDGHCTRACTRDDVCGELAPGAECVESPESPRAGQCAVWCSQDSACMGLGAGSYCGGAFCVAADLVQLPASFEFLELSRQVESAPPPAGSECDPSDVAASIEVNARTERLSSSACQRAPGDRAFSHTSRRRLTDDELDQIRAAYRALRPSTARRCDSNAEALSLDLEAEGGQKMLFADADHSDCPGRDPYRQSFVDGLPELYLVLTSMLLVER
jgi:hypothetical protein